MDPGNNGVIKFSFKLNKNQTVQETDLFRIDPKTGLITSKVAFDREQNSQYSIVLSASDHLAEPNQFETLQELIIKIGDLDDNVAEFSRPQSLSNLISAKNNLLISSSSRDENSIESTGLLSTNNDEMMIINNQLDFTYLFQISENLPRSTVVGKVEAIDRDEKPENRKIFYFIVDGNEQGLFSINLRTGVLITNQPLDRENQSFYQLIVKATPNENYTVNQMPTIVNHRNLTQKFKMERQRSYLIDDPTLAIVGIEINDLNDNEPVFDKELYRVAVSHQAKLNDTLIYTKGSHSFDNHLIIIIMHY